ncbi:uncharacterized protein LOC116445396 [Corvus moneduloides]|uniref:uncharacterized protein LOC116445396 n=1 Tax=Corvus moneduloides TaxID=1196302 RepID=UPI0013628D74|nr:uncharacterized protein LOC116445396 [Corvus moneduloides]
MGLVDGDNSELSAPCRLPHVVLQVPKADSDPCRHRCYRFSHNLPFHVREQQLGDVLMCLCQWSVDEEARPAEEEDEEVWEDGDSGHQRLGKAQIQLLLEFEHNLFLSRSPASLGQDLSQSLLGPGSEREAANGAGEFLGALWHPNTTEGILEELENAVTPSVEFLGNGKQQKQQEQSWKQAPARNPMGFPYSLETTIQWEG